MTSTIQHHQLSLDVNPIKEYTLNLSEGRKVSNVGGFQSTKFTEPPQCMPDEFKCDDYVRAYRNYYIHKIGEWKHPPKWFQSLDADPYYANV